MHANADVCVCGEAGVGVYPHVIGVIRPLCSSEAYFFASPAETSVISERAAERLSVSLMLRPD